MKRWDSLFVKTSLTLTFGLILFISLSIYFAFFFILSPLSNRAADDMAAIIKMTSQTWLSLSEQERSAFETRVASQHDLIITGANDIAMQELTKNYPFIPRLERALKRHTGQNVVIKQAAGNDSFLWAELNFATEKIKIGFDHNRPGPRPPVVLTAIFFTAALIIIILTNLLVRRITLPLKKMANAANQFGKKQFFTRIPETGSAELASLANSFNGMIKEISQLMENRAIFFAGISHDLRTPITRMQIALELLGQDKAEDEVLITGLRNDLIEMEFLIKQSLEFIKGVDKQHAEKINIDKAFSEIVRDYHKRGFVILLESEQCGICEIELEALKRVLSNLLDNAFQYGGCSSVKLSYKKNQHHIIIRISDEGPGIPEDKTETVFQPFFRLEHSRNKKTGGSGLGLAIVRQLCDSHGWKIRLISRKGRGLEACLEIPI